MASQKFGQQRYQWLHGLFIVLNVVGLGWYISVTWDPHHLVKYFSLQAFELAILYSFTSFFNKTRQSKITQVLYQLSLTFNIIICLGYWIIIYPYMVANNFSEQLIYCNNFTHTMPVFMLFVINYLECPSYFTRQNITYQFNMFMVAAAINIVYSILDGPVYLFMDYKSIGTLIFLVGGFVTLMLLFLTFNKITMRRLQKRNIKME